MTPETCPAYAYRVTFDATHFRIYNGKATKEGTMKWLHDPAADEDLSRTDEELTRAGHTATPRGRAPLGLFLLFWLRLETEERRVGKGCFRTCSSCVAPYD